MTFCNRILSIGLLIAILLNLNACYGTKVIAVPEEQRQANVPEAYTKQCDIPQFSGKVFGDLVNFADIQKAALKECNGKIELIKEWDAKHNGRNGSSTSIDRSNTE